MGRLVQSPQAAGTDRQHPAGRVGTGVLSPTGRVGHDGLTQTNGSPEKPGGGSGQNNARVVTAYDSLHPAVFNAIHHVIKEVHLRGKPVGVGGKMAGDQAGALLLLGMGVDASSVSAENLAHVKLAIRSFTLQRVRSLLAEVLVMEDGIAIHRLLSGALEEAGVYGF